MSAVAGAARRVCLLTPRQTETLYLLALGCANKEIAARLSIEPRTVRNHLTAVYATLGVPNRVAAVLAWHRYQREMGG